MSRAMVVSLLCLGLLIDISSANASNCKSRVVAAGRKAQRSALEFTQKFNKLSALEQESVKSALAKLNLPDSDSDGVPDLIEKSSGSDSCKSDSDDDGQPDSSEREAEGKISAVSDASLTVGGLVFVIDEDTVLEGISREELIVNACVEIHGALVADAIVANKIESSDDCSSGHHGDSHQHH